MDRDSVPQGTFVDKGAYDPLRHSCADLFWHHMEPCFHPFLADDVTALRSLEPKALREQELSVPETPQERERRLTQGENCSAAEESVAACVRSFPITQRLVAAFLDEGKGQSSASRALRQNPVPEPTWFPGPLAGLRSFNRILETRIKAELLSVGLLRPEDDDEAAETMRLDQWHLRNLTTGNTTTHSRLKKNLITEVQTQSARREKKRSYDLVEVQYLKKMMETGGKRGRTRFTKLLGKMHPHRELEIGAPMPRAGKSGNANGPGDTASTHERKKKKRKSNSHHSDRHKSKANIPGHPIGHKDSGNTDGGGDIASHVAAIIQRHGNAASLDLIVDEFVKSGPHLGMDEAETRSKINNVVSFSRKPFKFTRHPETKTYFVERV